MPRNIFIFHLTKKNLKIIKQEFLNQKVIRQSLLQDKKKARIKVKTDKHHKCIVINRSCLDCFHKLSHKKKIVE